MSQFAECDHYYRVGLSSLVDSESDRLKSYGYVSEGSVFYTPYTQSNQVVPLFQLYGNGDHFYTIDIKEVESAVNLGYEKEGIACFVYPSELHGTVP